MTAIYRLRFDGSITLGRKRIGRVYHTASGYVGQIGGHVSPGYFSTSEAFHEAAARHMGFASDADFREHNRKARRINKANSKRDRAFLHALFHGSPAERRNALDYATERYEDEVEEL